MIDNQKNDYLPLIIYMHCRPSIEWQKIHWALIKRPSMQQGQNSPECASSRLAEGPLAGNLFLAWCYTNILQQAWWASGDAARIRGKEKTRGSVVAPSIGYWNGSRYPRVPKLSISWSNSASNRAVTSGKLRGSSSFSKMRAQNQIICILQK